jgi:signal transduction histidine kinase
MAAAITLALILSAACATLLAQKVMEPLERSLRRLREFELDASHELRGPLAAMAANAEMGLLDCGAGDRAQRSGSRPLPARRISCGGWWRICSPWPARNKGVHTKRSTWILGSWCTSKWRSTAMRSRYGASASRQTWSREVVHGHAGLLHQLVRNLLDNAHRYSPEGSLIRGRVFRKGRQAFLEVSEEGPGISAEDLPRVFDWFWRAVPIAAMEGMA